MTDLPDTHPLVQYSHGQISRQVAIDRMQYRDYATLLVALGEADLPMPMPSDDQIEKEVETFRMPIRS
ncbi:hypothetical protein O9X99_01845 [Agrobacterium salinitolerans]|uniref:Uncharacterized protein n=1 Tax=Agrobacterium salinitolerans TaxID=1183413 RepID=A0ABY3BW37_9HYPH|nr:MULTISPECIES: hypothetical protein [Agrobacterium]MCZ7890409.1 hypothetical protein [Agrobacterium salinitolerans]TRA96868.1 hypothetical protein EXN23_01105 [Agrobacterium salinitolerans]